MKKIVVMGSINIDNVFTVDHMPVAGESILSSSYSIFPGGKGANQAYALARMGADVTMLGAVGCDANGDTAIKNLQDAGVNVRHILRSDLSTGITSIAVNKDGDNCIIVAQGANLSVNCTYVDDNIDVIKQADILIMQLETTLDAVCHAASLAKSFGTTVFLDPAPISGILPNELIKNADIIKPNETELEKMTGFAATEQDMPKALGMLHRQGAKCVLVSMGSQGAVLSRKDEKAQLFPAPKVISVDSTAAGDSFVAAVTYALTNGKTIESAVKFANQVASIVVTRKGAQTSIPTCEEMLELSKDI